MLTNEELRSKVSEIRGRQVTPKETAEELRILRSRLNERLEVAEIRLGELRVSYTRDERHVGDACEETKAALLKEIKRIRNELQVSTRPTMDFFDELKAFASRLLQEYKSGIDAAEKEKNPGTAKFYRDQLEGAGRASGLLRDELDSMPARWEGDRRGCASMRQETREAEVLSLLRSQEDERNEEIESEKRRRFGVVAGQVEARRAANKAAGIVTDEVAKPGQY